MVKCCFANCLNDVHNIVSTKVCQGLKHIWEDHRIALIGTASLIIAYKAHGAYKRRERRNRWNAVGKDVIVLHGFARAKTCTNLSPYIVKLETYLRMAGLKYEYDSEEFRGPKNKTPWITINGEELGDSELIMDFLGKKFNLNFSSSLTSEQKGVARSMEIMANEHFSWGLGDWRFNRDKDIRFLDLMDYPKCYRHLLHFTMRAFRSKLVAQGLGFHSADEIERIMVKDLDAFSTYLGKKLFMMGNEPSEVDCSVFGVLSQVVWATPGSPYASLVQTDYRNLMHYCFRIKEKFYPDWDNCVL